MDFMKLKRKKTVFDNFDNLSNASCHLFKKKIFEKTVENVIRLHVTCLRYLNLQKMKNNRISRVQKRRKKSMEVFSSLFIYVNKIPAWITLTSNYNVLLLLYQGKKVCDNLLCLHAFEHNVHMWSSLISLSH